MRTLVYLTIVLLAFSHRLDAAQRKALVIGNSIYFDPSLPADQQPSNLKNPFNDAELMASSLRGIGFDVSHQTDLDIQGMKAALGSFRSQLNTGDIAIVYFSGHGFQIKGENYLIPVHFAAKFEYQASSEALSLTTILSALEEAGLDLKIVFLDCCRNDPNFRSFSKSGTRGLGEVKNAGNETLVCFSTKHGEVAADNPESPNSNYTSALAEMISLPGLKVEEMMKRVTQQVVAKSANQQQPFIYGNLIRDWYLGPQDGTPPPPVTVSSNTEAMLLARLEELQMEMNRLKSEPKPAPQQETTSLPSTDNVKKSLLAFLQSWWVNQQSNVPSVWADDFTQSVDYCYKADTFATRSFLIDDRRKLTERWPNRSYELVEAPDNPSYIAESDGSTAKVTIRFRYEYSSGSRHASGASSVSLDLVRSGSTWKISRFDETVDKD